MTMVRRLVFVTALGLAACASSPKFDVRDVDPLLTPQRAVERADDVKEFRILWGGIIVGSRNAEKTTQLEVIAYPLDKNQRPRPDRETLGRFFADYSGYLETVDYAPGREITVLGTLSAPRAVRVDNVTNSFPAVTTRDVYLWPKRSDDSEPRVRFGIGVMIHN